MYTIPQPMNDEDDYYGLRSVRDTCTAARAPRRPRSFVTALALSSGIFGDDSAETLTTEKARRRASVPSFLSPPNRLHLRHCQLRVVSRPVAYVASGAMAAASSSNFALFSAGSSRIVRRPCSSAAPRPRTQGTDVRFAIDILFFSALLRRVWLPFSSASILFYRVISGRRLVSSRLLPTGRRREVIIGSSLRNFFMTKANKQINDPMSIARNACMIRNPQRVVLYIPMPIYYHMYAVRGRTIQQCNYVQLGTICRYIQRGKDPRHGPAPSEP